MLSVVGLVRYSVYLARNLTDGVDGFMRGMRYAIHDRDPLVTRELCDVLRAAGVKRGVDRLSFASCHSTP